jgi:hypothetical protein
MKKLLIICLFILLSIIPFSGIKQVVADSENQFQVITKCNLYKEAKINYEEENGIVVQLFFGDVINVAGEPVKEENEDFYFYQASITKNGTEYNGYVIINFVTSVDNVGLERTLDPNAKTLNKANIYTAKDENEKFVLGDKEVVLDQYQGIKVLDGYDRSKNFHQIMFEVDGNIYTGYIKTSDLLVEGYNATTLVVVFIFILVAGIALSIFFTTRKKRKKQKNNTIETL